MSAAVNKWDEITINSDREVELTENAGIVLEKRYLARDENGKTVETPRSLFERVAKYVASADLLYGKDAKHVSQVADAFYEMMADLLFIPNSPTLMNAGRPLGQLSACFVLPVEDSMDGIFDSIKHMALIHKSGGGTGFSFTKLRPKNDTVQTTKGVSSGPVSFMSIFNAATETVKQGGTRRGANMAILHVTHPDILEFIKAKEHNDALTNFNCSVALSDVFMNAVLNNEEYELINPRNGKPSGTLNAREVFSLIVRMAWKNGEPGIVFIDRINEKNALKKIGLIESTNPCGEQPLLPYESCNLGSINVAKCIIKNGNKAVCDYELLKDITYKAVHFLDNVIDVNRYPLPLIEEHTKANRKIGLGVMGFADMLIALGIPYNSEAAVQTAKNVMSAVQEASKEASRALAKERGAFPNFPYSDYAHSGEEPLRNATTTTIAPTGTISIIAGTSSGVEPIFALAYVRNVLDNNTLIESHPQFVAYCREHGLYNEQRMQKVAHTGSIAHMEDFPEEARALFVTAHDITPQWHVRIQAAFQEFVDNAVSKTVNFPHSAAVADIESVYLLAYKSGCKGITVYRDGSRDTQVLQVQKEKEHAPVTIQPRPRKEITWGKTVKMNTGCGSLYVTINEDEFGLFEVFATMGKAGGCAASQAEAVSRLISLGLRSGLEPEQIIKQLKGVRCPNQAWVQGGKIYSCADAIAKAIERYVHPEAVQQYDEDIHKSMAETNGKGSGSVMVGVCPDCHGPLEFESGCSVCRICGFSRCG